MILGTPMVLVGNMADLGDEARKVSREEGQGLANEFGIPFVESSAVSGVGVKEIFELLIGECNRVGYFERKS
jgi:Fe2+ transport system protein B